MREAEIMAILGGDEVFSFMQEFIETRDKYNSMKKVYNKKIRDRILDLVDEDGGSIGNDVFKVNVTSKTATKKLISKRKAESLPQDIKDMIFIEGMTSQRVTITFSGDEEDDYGL